MSTGVGFGLGIEDCVYRMLGIAADHSKCIFILLTLQCSQNGYYPLIYNAIADFLWPFTVFVDLDRLSERSSLPCDTVIHRLHARVVVIEQAA